LAHAGARLVLAPGGLPEGIAPVGVAVLAAEALAAACAGGDGTSGPPPSPTTGAEIAYLMYTSGSTGDPKGVRISAENLAGFVAWARAAHPVEGGRRFLNQAPFSFDLSVMDLYLALTTGGTLGCVDRAMIENPLALRDELVALAPEVWVSTPSFAELCLRDRRFAAAALPDLATFLFCGEVLTPACVEALVARFPGARIYDLYGPTEATVAVTSARVDGAGGRPWPLGAPRPDTRLLVVDEAGREVGPDRPGEIVIEGPCVSPGYHRAPDLTARAFVGEAPRRRYRTGDAGRVRDGAVHFEGRMDFQVKLRGHRIELDDVAANLRRLPGVVGAAVVPRLVEGRCEALVGFVVLRAGADPDAGRLRAALSTHLPAYMVPQEIRRLDALPMTPNGKLDRAALAGRLTDGWASAAPRG
jgi:D-alanine--poly(phosphoribitol) ligase subunit 1